MNLFSEEVQDLLILTNFSDKARLFPGWWKKADCKYNPRAIFVFGDNDVQKGCGGQAIIRYCPNAMGIPTKKFPSYADGAYYTDREFEKNKMKIVDSIENLILAFDSGEYDVIYFPEDGLGTGLSKLDEKAPRTLEFLNDLIYDVFKIDYADSSNQPDSGSSDSSE